jgi:hypothetical protein
MGDGMRCCLGAEKQKRTNACSKEWVCHWVVNQVHGMYTCCWKGEGGGKETPLLRRRR